MHAHERGVLDDLIGKVDSERIAREAKTEAHRAVLTPEVDVRVEIEHRVFLTQVCLVRDSLDVILAVLDEAAVGQRAAVLQQALCEPRSTCWSVVVFAGGTKR